MIIYPAIDIYNGQGVRLEKGQFNQVTVYGEPIEILKNFQGKGSEYVHIVDLNGAKSETDQIILILELLKSTTMKVQVAGGIRTLEKAEKLLAAGADKIVLGSSVITNYVLFDTLVNLYPDHIAVAIDVKQDRLAIEGWLKDGGSKDALLKKLSRSQLKRIIYTDINKDGMMAGPNFQAYEYLVKNTKFEIIASGGVSSLSDLKRLKEIGVYGAIVGKSIYENKIDLKEAIHVG